jgi:hypothetical protein
LFSGVEQHALAAVEFDLERLHARLVVGVGS